MIKRLVVGGTALLLLAAASPILAQQAIAGRLVDAETGQPVAGAIVLLLDGGGERFRSDITERDGFFSFLAVPAAVYRMEAGRLGYERVVTDPFAFDAAAPLEVELRLKTDAVALAPLEIIVRASPRRNPLLSGFYSRQRGALGSFITRQDIEARQPTRTTDLLLMMPGVRLGPTTNGGGRTVLMSRASRSAAACPVQIFLDGIHMNRRLPRASATADDVAGAARFSVDSSPQISIDHLIDPGSVEGIEVYNGMSTVPAEFVNIDSRCGTILIWTRRGP